jgi:hypothetical protein
MALMAHARLGRVLVVVHSAQAPSASEWAAYIDTWQVFASAIAVESVRTLVFTDGGAPDAEQRARLNNVLAGRPTPVAVLSDSFVVRSVCSTLSMFNRGLKVFSPGRLAEAMQFLGLQPSEQSAAMVALQQMKSALKSTTLNCLPIPPA